MNLNSTPIRTRTPLMVGQAGLSIGDTQAELLVALRSGSRRLLFGQTTSEMTRMLPEPAPSDILTIVAESRLLHAPDVFRVLAASIHQKAHLLPDDIVKLEIILTELLSNAIEHGNLGLTSHRQDKANEKNWFADYTAQVKHKLSSPLGRIPVLIQCQRSGAMVTVSIEDKGLGFNVSAMLTVAKNPQSATGRGIAVAMGLASGRLTYSSNGRKVSFSLATQSNSAQRVPTRSSIRQNSRILVVDDQATVRTTLLTILRNNGFMQVQEVSEHANLVDIAQKTSANMILLNILMPEPDGFKLYTQLKSVQETAGIPVIFLCQSENPQQKHRAFQLGAQDVISKPLDPAEVVARVENHLYYQATLSHVSNLTGQLEGELERAKTFQHDLFPSARKIIKMADMFKVEIASHYEGCETLAGDYWTVIPINDKQFAFALADFTGHGTIAALNTVQLHTMLRHETNLTNPALTTASLNAQLSRMLGKGSFATFVFGVIDREARTLTYTGCGAPNLLLKHANGSVEELSCAGLPLGLSPDVSILPRTAKLEDGCTILAYSDALTDTEHAPTNQSWQKEKLRHTFNAIPSQSGAQALVDDLLKTFYATAVLPLKDDLTLLGISLQTP